MAKTKRYYAQRVMEQLQNDYPNQDFKIQERDVFPVLDDVVNKFAEKNYFDNWQYAGTGIDEGYITTWDSVDVVDGDNETPSYFIFPSTPADLPRNRGIDDIYPLKFQDRGRNHSVVVMSHADYRRYTNLYAGKLEGRLGGYRRGNKFHFTTCGVKKKYGNMSVRLVVRDASQFSITDIYPIPSNREGEVIEAVLKFFMAKRAQPTDQVRDSKDQA
jgi:hypothetical protein